MPFLGLHTVADTNDLIKLVQYRFDQVKKGFESISTEKKNADPKEYAEIQALWSAEKERWGKVREDVVARLWKINWSNPAIPADHVVAENEWQEVLQFVEYGGKVNGQIVERKPTDLRSVQERIEKMLGRPIDLQGRPSFTADDPDHATFLKLDAAIKAGEQGSRQVVKEAAKTGKEVSDAITSSPVFWVSAAALVIGGIVYLKKG